MTAIAWQSAKHPGTGDAVRIVLLRRGDELGDIRIQDYGSNVRVAAFIPGYETSFPGDTPKMNSDFDAWFTMPAEKDQADSMFDQYLASARQDGWDDYKP